MPQVRQLKQGDFFTLTKIEEPKETQVYIRGEYDRTTKKFSCYKFSDVNYERMLAPNKVVYTGFTF